MNPPESELETKAWRSGRYLQLTSWVFWMQGPAEKMSAIDFFDVDHLRNWELDAEIARLKQVKAS